MPYKRRTPKKKRNRGYTTAHLNQLRTGHDYGEAFGQPKAFGDIRRSASARAAFADAWEVFRDELLLDWIRSAPRAGDHGGPGTRPYAWWVLDAPERRQRIDGRPHPFDNPERLARVAGMGREIGGKAMGLFYGVPAILCVQDDFAAIFETEAEYLDRLGLWLPGEQELLAEWRAREPEPRECEQWADDCAKLDGGEW